MAEGYGNQVGHWRCKVVAGVTALADTTATVHVQCVWQSLGWGFAVDYNTVSISCDGQSSTREYFAHVDSPTGGWVDRLVLDGDFVVPRTSADRQVQCGASFVMPDYEAGGSYASCSVTVQAQDVDPPAPPTGVTATRQSDTVLAVQWTNNATSDAPYTSTDVQVCEDGGEWGAPAGGTQNQVPPQTSAVWQHAAPNHVYRFRVRAVNSAAYGAWVESGDVYTTPAAPGSLSASFAASSGTVALSWTKTALYASSVQVQRSGNGSSWSDAATPSASATSWTDSDPPDGTAWYRVRYGVGGLWSAWSQVGPVSTYTSADYPTVAITGPQSPVRDRPITATWTVGGPDPVASQDVSLIVDGLVVDLAYPSASARSVELSASALPDGGSGTVVVSATDTKGLSTTAVMGVSADYWPPAFPEAVFGRSCDGRAVLTVSAGTGQSVSETTGFDVVRAMPDGSKQTVASGVQAGKVVDAHPPLNVAYSYEVTALSDVGKSSTSTVKSYVGSRGGYVDFPDGESFPVLLDPSHYETVERSGKAVDFAGSSPYPVWYPGTDVDASPTFGFKVLRADYDRLRDEAYASDEVWVRDGFGHVWHGHPRWTLSPAVGGRYADVTLDLTVTEVR